MTQQSGKIGFSALLLPWIIPGALLLAWYLISASKALPEYLLPAPATVGRAMLNYILGEPGTKAYAGRFLPDLMASLARIGTGFGIAVCLGLPLGLCSGRSSFICSLFSGLISGLRAVPGISWLPLALVWFGIGFKTSVFLISLAAFFPIYLASLNGAAQVPELLLRAGRMLGLGRTGLLFKVVVPSAMPKILTGMRLGLGISFAYLVLGELTGVPDGVGALIMDARMTGRIEIVLVGVVVLAGAGVLADWLLVRSVCYFFPGMRRI